MVDGEDKRSQVPRLTFKRTNPPACGSGNLTRKSPTRLAMSMMLMKMIRLVRKSPTRLAMMMLMLMKMIRTVRTGPPGLARDNGQGQGGHAGNVNARPERERGSVSNTIQIQITHTIQTWERGSVFNVIVLHCNTPSTD